MSYEEQLSAAKFRAERDQARQEVYVAEEKLGRAMKELGEAKRKAGVHGKVISDQNQRIHDLKREVEKMRLELEKLRGDALRSEIVGQSMDNIEREIKLGVNSIAELLEIGSEIQELPIAEVCPRIVAEMEKRLLPKGMEWPLYDTGELVLIGDDVIGPDYGESIHVDEITFHANGFTLREKMGLDHWYESDDRFERPAVLAADGEPLEVGQTVWHVSNGIQFTVVELPKSVEYQAVNLRLDDGAFTGLDPDQLTHQRPVLDADDVPIKEGDEVWFRTGSAHGVVESINANSILPLIVYRGDNGELYRDAAEDVTHTKPEIDSWERIEEDLKRYVCNYFDHHGKPCDGCPAFDDESGDCESVKAADLMRRCKALAEKENGNE